MIFNKNKITFKAYKLYVWLLAVTCITAIYKTYEWVTRETSLIHHCKTSTITWVTFIETKTIVNKQNRRFLYVNTWQNIDENITDRTYTDNDDWIRLVENDTMVRTQLWLVAIAVIFRKSKFFLNKLRFLDNLKFTNSRNVSELNKPLIPSRTHHVLL